MKPLTPKRLVWICSSLLLVLLVIVVISLKVGAVRISVVDLVVSLGRVAIGRSDQLPSEYSLIVFDIRLPRILLGILVGASLSVAGAGFQALLRNPLADPFVLGVSSGAAVGAILSLIIASKATVAMPIAAFAGALIAITGVYFLGRRGGQIDTNTLLLAGIITASFLSALIIFLMNTLHGGEQRGISYWLMGDLSSTSTPIWIGWLFVVLVIAIGVVYSTAADLNLLLSGEQEAMHLGVDVPRVKLVVYVSASLLTGLAVSVSGSIGYVGLLVPHAMRLLFGSDYRLLIPTTAIGGAITIVTADMLARTITFPTELPVGAITALVGAPVFIYLLRRRLQ